MTEFTEPQCQKTLRLAAPSLCRFCAAGLHELEEFRGRAGKHGIRVWPVARSGRTRKITVADLAHCQGHWLACRQ